MNDENENNEPVVDEIADTREALIAELQDELEKTQDALAVAADAAREPAAPAGDDELRALAVTVRTAQRSGHPDASKHLDTLLTALGAV